MRSAGKSTALKQVSRVFSGDFSIDERQEARQMIFNNLFRYLLAACDIVIERRVGDVGLRSVVRKTARTANLVD